jgi:glycosyltransferase involved in cell wall biosynthesis
MKILFLVNDFSFGGAERHLVTLAAGLSRRGHEVQVASIKAAGPAAPLAAALREEGVYGQFCLHSRGSLDWQALARLVRLLRDARPQIVVATSQYALMYACLARLRCRTGPALAYICHSMGVLRHTRAERLRFAVYRWFYRMADCVVFVSELQKSFVHALGVRPRRAEVVHNGVNLAHFDAAALAGAAQGLRAEHGLQASDLVVGLCAVLREEKRPLDLLEAIARLRQSGVAARAVVIGDGPLRPRIEARIAALGLERAVVLAGYREDVRPWLAACDVLALTSATEAFPMATLEAMALGRPLVASAVGGLPEQVTDGDNGLLYPAGDVPRLAGALQRLCDPAVRARMGLRAQAIVRQRFDVQHMTDRYQAIFASLLPEDGQRAPGGIALTDQAP